MAYLMNRWYVAAWAHEVGDQLFHRRLLGENVLIFRESGGRAVAIADRCPHRFAPLHLGRRRGDAVECRYHGLRFDGTGACVHSPHGHQLPRHCEVRAYPLVERHGVLWIWPGTAAADPEAIADFSYLTAPGHKTVHGSARLRAHYELVSDNLMDASHTQFVHEDQLATDAFAGSRHEVLQEGDAVHSNYYLSDSPIPTAYRPYFSEPDQLVAFSICFRWLPPALVRNNVTLAPVGKPPTAAIRRIGSHFMTPETAESTHYFFAHTRNFETESADVDARIRRWQQHGLVGQDGAMIEAVQETMGTTDLDSLSPALFAIDTAAVRVRRRLAELVAEEAAAAERGRP
mgnify:CR=1 FL=1|jgi:vanillate O-demethylase monooxygenase subunit